jgi:sugar O-acyltransferase (sialic acid O-acetyltransferase NeuD family)
MEKLKEFVQIIGKGGFAREVALYCSDYKMFEYDEVEDIFKSFGVVIAISDIQTRIKFSELNLKWINLHKGETLGNVYLGHGNIICRGVIMTTGIEIGNHCQFNLLTTVGHDCKIGDYVTCAPKVSISGNCTIGNRVYIGTGAVIKEKIKICDDVIIGANSFVNRDIVEPGTYAGNPAIRIMYTNKSGIEYGGIEIKAKKKYL